MGRLGTLKLTVPARSKKENPKHPKKENSDEKRLKSSALLAVVMKSETPEA